MEKRESLYTFYSANFPRGALGSLRKGKEKAERIAISLALLHLEPSAAGSTEGGRSTLSGRRKWPSEEGSTAFHAWQEVTASSNMRRWRDPEPGASPALPKLTSPVILGCFCFSFSFLAPQP